MGHLKYVSVHGNTGDVYDFNRIFSQVDVDKTWPVDGPSEVSVRTNAWRRLVALERFQL